MTSIRSNAMENRVSTDSPLGKALLRHKVGDRVEIRVNPDYSYFVVIRSIEKTGEEEESIRNF